MASKRYSMGIKSDNYVSLYCHSKTITSQYTHNKCAMNIYICVVLSLFLFEQLQQAT